MVFVIHILIANSFVALYVIWIKVYKACISADIHAFYNNNYFLLQTVILTYNFINL